MGYPHVRKLPNEQTISLTSDKAMWVKLWNGFMDLEGQEDRYGIRSFVGGGFSIAIFEYRYFVASAHQSALVNPQFINII